MYVILLLQTPKGCFSNKSWSLWLQSNTMIPNFTNSDELYTINNNDWLSNKKVLLTRVELLKIRDVHFLL